MDHKVYAFFWISLMTLDRVCWCAPQNDIDRPFDNTNVDYNTVISHFKDFFMYLPVMMTTLKETMTGFPKFAEGIRILTSRSGRLDDDCKCRGGSGSSTSSERGSGSSNEIESNRYG